MKKDNGSTYIILLFPRDTRLIFYLSKSRNHKTAKRFFTKALQSVRISKPRVIYDKKEQVAVRDQSIQSQKQFIHQLFGLTA
ncbi:hypothetical protein BK767_31610 [Bacillus thuringiensis serovar kyushuensis]|nr:hypothetical protein BK767_31610 [Bacillus thuringiensis serovar kyushuensis]OTZ63122.1 hypothetical protein BK768_31890 [Bacillus thuringiensis serovar tohokuensis]OUB78248.1 hypothetical protein BK773_30185 [Bacillus thuringiensis serovar indiana]